MAQKFNKYTMRFEDDEQKKSLQKNKLPHPPQNYIVNQFGTRFLILFAMRCTGLMTCQVY